MLAAIHEDLPIAVDVPLKEEKDVRRFRVRRVLDDPQGIGGDSRHAGWQAVRFRIILRLPGIHELFRLGQERNRLPRSEALRKVTGRAAAKPDS